MGAVKQLGNLYNSSTDDFSFIEVLICFVRILELVLSRNRIAKIENSWFCQFNQLGQILPCSSSIRSNNFDLHQLAYIWSNTLLTNSAHIVYTERQKLPTHGASFVKHNPAHEVTLLWENILYYGSLEKFSYYLHLLYATSTHF